MPRFSSVDCVVSEMDLLTYERISAFGILQIALLGLLSWDWFIKPNILLGNTIYNNGSYFIDWSYVLYLKC